MFLDGASYKQKTPEKGCVHTLTHKVGHHFRNITLVYVNGKISIYYQGHICIGLLKRRDANKHEMLSLPLGAVTGF